MVTILLTRNREGVFAESLSKVLVEISTVVMTIVVQVKFRDEAWQSAEMYQSIQRQLSPLVDTWGVIFGLCDICV